MKGVIKMKIFSFLKSRVLRRRNTSAKRSGLVNKTFFSNRRANFRSRRGQDGAGDSRARREKIKGMLLGNRVFALVVCLLICLVLTRWFRWPYWYISLFPSLLWWDYKKWEWRLIWRHPLSYILFIPWAVYFVLIVLMGLTG